MYFVLKSEMEAKKGFFCPFCNESHVKLLDKKELYTKFFCWNENCQFLNHPFILINKKILNELTIDLRCKRCGTRFSREFQQIRPNLIYLIFKCELENCSKKENPFIYNLTKGIWEGNIPKLKRSLDILSSENSKLMFDNLYDLIVYLLVRENKPLSAIEIYRLNYRESLLDRTKEISWLIIGKFIRKDIKINKENSVFIEVRQGLFDLRKRFISSKKKDEFDLLKEEYDWEFFVPKSLILYYQDSLKIKIRLNYLIPEIPTYLKSLDVDEKRRFLNSDGFKWRRSLNLLNLNSMDKKKEFFKNLKLKNNHINLNNDEIELILDLNNNEIRSKKNYTFLKKLKNISFNRFKYKSLFDKDFYNFVENELKFSNTDYEKNIKNERIQKENVDAIMHSKENPINFAYDAFFLNIYRYFSNKVEIIRISSKALFNESIKSYLCKCGRQFFKSTLLFNHIIQSIDCLNQFLTDKSIKKKHYSKKCFHRQARYF